MTLMAQYQALSFLTGAITTIRAAQNAGRITRREARDLVHDMHDTFDMITEIRQREAAAEIWRSMAVNSRGFDATAANSGPGGRL